MHRIRQPVALMLLIAAGLICPGTPARADATVRLVGRVPPRASVQIGGGIAVASIDLSKAGSSYTLFSMVDSTNGAEGYTITVISMNAQANGTPELISNDGNPPIPYRLTYDGQSLIFRNGVAELRSVGSEKHGDHKGAVDMVPLRSAAAAAHYTDTLVLVIRSK